MHQAMSRGPASEASSLVEKISEVIVASMSSNHLWKLSRKDAVHLSQGRYLESIQSTVPLSWPPFLYHCQCLGVTVDQDRN